MCRAKEVAEQIKRLREEEKDAIYKWFVDDIVEEMIQRKVTTVNRAINETKIEFENRGYTYSFFNLSHYLKKEGFEAIATTDYDGEPYGFEVYIKREYLHEE